MKPSPKEELTISEAIESLRSQLLDAKEWAEGEALTFALDSVEVELQMTVAVGHKGEAKVGLWSVLTVGGEASRTQGQTHVVRLKLQPELGVRRRPDDKRVRLSDDRD